VILLGHCGGAITASLVAARDPAANAGLIFIALPVLYSEAEGNGRAPGRVRRLTRALDGWARRAPRRAGRGLHPRFNRAFAAAFDRLLDRGTPVLILLPGLDEETRDFDRELRGRVLDARACRIVDLPDTDHSVMFEASRCLLHDALASWIPRADRSRGAAAADAGTAR
jgi:pimeloyl-ACP methyl ester carboxylesterase